MTPAHARLRTENEQRDMDGFQGLHEREERRSTT